VAVDAAGLAARELGDVRVALLRHDRRAGAVAVGEVDEAEVWLIQSTISSASATRASS
jgi:hypothetical protein